MESNPTPTSGTRGTPAPKKRPWWVSTRGLVQSIALFLVWTALCVLRLTLLKTQHDWWHIAIIVVSGLLALSYVAATIFWIRNRPVRMDRDTGSLLP
jgi:Na+/melibiose symporter-like transporter